MAQLLLQQGNVVKALEYFERAAELSRTEGEIVNALSYAEATRTQLEVSQASYNTPEASAGVDPLQQTLTAVTLKPSRSSKSTQIWPAAFSKA